MNEWPEIIAEVWRWVEKADHDLRCAEYVITMKENCPFEGRYPGDWEPITEEETHEAIKMTRVTREAVRKRLPDEALEHRGEKG